MATVNKDFRVKHGLVVEGTNATVDGSDIITEDAIVGGTQTNVVVTYDAVNKVVNFAAESGLADGDTDDLAEGTTNKYFTNQRAIDAVKENIALGDLSDVIATGTSGGEILTYAAGSWTPVDLPTVLQNTADTGDLPEGTNLYYTDSRARNAISGSGAINYDNTTGEISVEAGNATTTGLAVKDGELKIDRVVVDTWYDAAGAAATAESNANTYTDTEIGDLTTSDIEEGTNLYYTDTRARGAISSGAGISYDSGTGVVAASIESGGGLGIANDNLAIKRATVDAWYEAAGSVDTHSDLTTGVHGVTGDVVGTTDVQALTNKTLGADTSLSEDLDASENKIVNLATPTDAFDAATKAYVDAKAEGLSVKPAVMAATTANLASTYDNGTLGVGATLTSTSNGAFPLIDGVQLSTLSGQRGLLVKNQTDATQNGRYNLTTLGDENTPWVLTRCGLCDEVTEIPSAYVFVQGGDLYEATGWAAFVENPTTFVVGDDNISWFQFAGAGTYLAGNGLNLDGNTFSIDDTVTATKDYVDTNFVNVADLPGELDDYVLITQKGAADGVATLDEDGQVPVTQLAHVTEAIDGLSTDDIEEGTTNLYFTDSRARDALEATDTNFLSVGLGFDNFASGGPVTLGKQFAATVNATKTNNYLYGWNLDVFSSAKFLIKTAYGTHTEISEYLVTSDTSYNLAVTEYAVVGTNGSLSTLSFSTASGGGSVNLTATVENFPATITIVGTLIA
jgi:hypothetical protein